MESLLKQKRIVSYQTSGEDIEEKVLDYNYVEIPS
jgi:hypothetical protein